MDAFESSLFVGSPLNADELMLVLDSLTAQVAVLDGSGAILAVNEAWRQFGRTEGLSDAASCIGVNYLDICEAATTQGDADAAAIADGLRGLLDGTQTELYREYPCNSPEQERWFVARARAHRYRDQLRVVVSHEDITQRKIAERKVQCLVDSLESRVAERTRLIQRQVRQLRRLAGELTLAESRQRRALSEELHDYLAQLLVVTKLRLERLTGAPEDDLAAHVQKTMEPLVEAIEYTRSLISKLHPQILFKEGLSAAMQALAWSMKQDRFDVTIEESGMARTLPQEVLIFMHDATRELLFNAMKHSGTRAATVEIEWRSEEVVVTVCDQGLGMAQPATVSRHRFGLTHMRARVEGFEGHLSVESGPGKGTRVSLAIPLPPDAPPA